MDLYPQLLLHISEKVEGLERGHVIEVGLVEFLLERGQKRVLKLEERELD
jgi:hypothetical protein